jgi:hypothetical protein
MSMNANLAMNDAEASRPRGWSIQSEGSYSVNRESAEPSAKKSRYSVTPSQQAVYNGSYSGKNRLSRKLCPLITKQNVISSLAFLLTSFQP